MESLLKSLDEVHEDLMRARVRGHFRRGRSGKASYVSEHEQRARRGGFVAFKSGGHPIGKTTTGKTIFSRWSNPAHAKFSVKEHKEAARLHRRLASKVSTGLDASVLHLKRAERHERSARKMLFGKSVYSELLRTDEITSQLLSQNNEVL